jgi:hypothetical protein
MRGLLGAALVMGLSCGPSKEDSVRLKEGANLDDIVECPGLLCAGETEFCAEILYEYGESPPVCVTDSICDRFECVGKNKRCVFFDGIPVQMRCIDND